MKKTLGILAFMMSVALSQQTSAQAKRTQDKTFVLVCDVQHVTIGYGAIAGRSFDEQFAGSVGATLLTVVDLSGRVMTLVSTPTGIRRGDFLKVDYNAKNTVPIVDLIDTHHVPFSYLQAIDNVDGFITFKQRINDFRTENQKRFVVRCYDPS